MRTILHIVTKRDKELLAELLERQRALPETKVEVVALAEGADYSELIEKIFAADSVAVW